MGFGLVIFDCDGVLIDSELLSVEADIACLAEFGIELSAEIIIERYVGKSDMVADLELHYGRPLPGFDDRQRQLARPLFEARLRAIPGAAAALAALPVPACVASSSSPDRLRHTLSLAGLYDRLHPHIFSAVEVARGKPAPDLFLHAARRMGADPADCLVVEDSLPGVAAAGAAGMTVLGFTGGSHCRPDHADRLRAAGAANVIAEMDGLAAAMAALTGDRR